MFLTSKQEEVKSVCKVKIFHRKSHKEKYKRLIKMLKMKSE